MVKIYKSYFRLFAGVLLLTSVVTSCKKDKPVTPTPVVTAKPLATIGMYEVQDSVYRRVFIPITKVGDKTVKYFGVFDTGSTGMTIDANGILPASMITSSGITVAGDSVVVNGITVTSKTAVISYGNKTDETSEYGNLAYAKITIGGSDGTVTTKRIPIFLYYKVLDVTHNKVQPQHANDVFGVGPGVSFADSHIASPLSYFDYDANVTNGFKLATFNKSLYTLNGTYVTSLLTIGLVPDDLSSSSGFVMHSAELFFAGGATRPIYQPPLLMAAKAIMVRYYSIPVPLQLRYWKTTRHRVQIMCPITP